MLTREVAYSETRSRKTFVNATEGDLLGAQVGANTWVCVSSSGIRWEIGSEMGTDQDSFPETEHVPDKSCGVGF